MKWKHPYPGVYRHRTATGLYEVECSMDDHLWRAWWLPDDDPYQRMGLTVIGHTTARAAKAEVEDHSR